MLIGDRFHWQTTIEARLPGNLISFERTSISDSDTLIEDSNISLINVLPLETYLESVVGSEMNPEAPIEFLKAHAVISRSWALGKILDLHLRDNEGKVNIKEALIGWDDTSAHNSFNVCSDDHCQRYQGLQEISMVALNAIRDTTNEVLMSPTGELVDTRFSKCCGGITEIFSTCWQPQQVSCLESFRDPWCDLSYLSPKARRLLLSIILKDYDQDTQGYGYSWTSEISKDKVEFNLKKHFNRNVGKILNLEVLHRGPSGRIDLLRIKGSEGYLDIGKELWIRRILSSSHLYSSAFDIEDYEAYFKFTGKGWGHGVGLCQIGAANMAANGFSYSDILSFYYPGSHIQKIP